MLAQKKFLLMTMVYVLLIFRVITVAMVIMCQTWSLNQWWPHIGRG